MTARYNRTSNSKSAAAAMALFCLGTGAAQAQDCKPLQLLSSVELVGDDPAVVPVSVNGKTAMMTVSTAAGLTSFTPDGAAALGLDPVSDANVVMLSASGNTSQRFVPIDDLAIGTVHVRRSQYMILPYNNPGSDIVGVIGGDLLSRYDVELDFSARKLNLFAQDHCLGRVIYWPHAATSMVPLREQQPTRGQTRTGYGLYLQRSRQLWVPVTLDGMSFQALINTGGMSSMDENAARVLGVRADSPGSAALPGEPSDSKSYRHTFSSLTFEGITLTNPKFVVHPDNQMAYARNFPRADTRLAKFDDGQLPYIVIGVDILRKTHMFASFGEHRLYLTEASSPAAPATSPAAGQR